MRRFSLLAAVLTVLAAFASPAFSVSESGSHGWSTQPLVLRNGPGAAYAVTGEIAGETAIKILRCQRLWCVVDGEGGRGWTSKDHVVFGIAPQDGLFDVSPDYASGNGEVCFFTGTNYTGASFCARSGQVFRDLALRGLDNHFSSVQLTGRTSVAACRDRFFQSYCERIVQSQPVLDQYLLRNLSSVRVY